MVLVTFALLIFRVIALDLSCLTENIYACVAVNVLLQLVIFKYQKNISIIVISILITTCNKILTFNAVCHFHDLC